MKTCKRRDVKTRKIAGAILYNPHLVVRGSYNYPYTYPSPGRVSLSELGTGLFYVMSGAILLPIGPL